MLGYDHKVVHTVSGSGVNAAGTAVQCNMIAEDQDGLAVQERMSTLHILQLAALDSTDDLIFLDAGFLHYIGSQLLGNYIVLSLAFPVCLEQCIVKVGSQADGNVCRQGPGGRSPDHHIGLARHSAHGEQLTLVVGYFKLDINRIAGIIGILNFSLSQGSAAVRAPVYRLQALVDVTLLCHLAEDLHLTGFKLRTEGQIRVVKIAQNTQTLELGALVVHIVKSKILAVLTQFQRRNIRCNADLLQSLELNGQSVGIPARDIGGLITGHILGADDHILEHLVQSGTQMDITVGVRRAVMQNISGLALIAVYHLLV